VVSYENTSFPECKVSTESEQELTIGFAWPAKAPSVNGVKRSVDRHLSGF
jgi:hypothetical protein